MTNEKKHLIVKEIFEKIKPKLVEKCGQEILTSIQIQAYCIFIDSKNYNFEKYYTILKNELKEQCSIEIGDNPVKVITLNFENKD